MFSGKFLGVFRGNGCLAIGLPVLHSLFRLFTEPFTELFTELFSESALAKVPRRGRILRGFLPYVHLDSAGAYRTRP